MKYVVAFDISNNRKRNAVVKACRQWGFRVQKSVFEIFMDSSKVDDFSEKLLKLINPDCDTIRLYPLDKDNDENIVIIGIGKPVRQRSYSII